MAKRKRPIDDDAPVPAAVQSTPVQPSDAQPAANSVSIDVPISDQSKNGYNQRHVDVYLSPYEQKVLSRVCRALIDADAVLPRIKDGKLVGTRIVASNQDALRWLLSELGQKSGLIEV